MACMICGAKTADPICKNCMEGIDDKEMQQMRDIASILNLETGVDRNIKEAIESILRLEKRLKNGG